MMPRISTFKRAALAIQVSDFKGNMTYRYAVSIDGGRRLSAETIPILTSDKWALAHRIAGCCCLN